MCTWLYIYKRPIRGIRAIAKIKTIYAVSLSMNYNYIMTEQILNLNKPNLASSLMEATSASFYVYYFMKG